MAARGACAAAGDASDRLSQQQVVRRRELTPRMRAFRAGLVGGDNGISRRDVAMFDLDQFIADCRAALAADKSHKNVREIVARAVSDPTAIPKGSGDHSRRSAPRNQPQLQPLQMLRYAYSERPRQHTPRPHRRAGSLEGPEFSRRPILSQGTDRAKRGSRKRSDPPRLSHDGPGLATTQVHPRVMAERS